MKEKRTDSPGKDEQDEEESEMTTVLKFRYRGETVYKDCVKCGQKQPAVYHFCWSCGKRFKKGGMPW